VLRWMESSPVYELPGRVLISNLSTIHRGKIRGWFMRSCNGVSQRVQLQAQTGEEDIRD
jgi:hypothetical protein